MSKYIIVFLVIAAGLFALILSFISLIFPESGTTAVFLFVGGLILIASAIWLMKKPQEMKRIVRFALFGAVGFGIGAIGFGIGGGLEPSPYGFATMGAVGGAALGLALRDWKRAIALALLGAIGFFFGYQAALALFPAPFFEVEVLGDILIIPEPRVFGGAALGLALVPGVLGGAALGLALLDWRKIIGLAIAGALALAIAVTIDEAFGLTLGPSPRWGLFTGLGHLLPLEVRLWLGWDLLGIIGGASLGATLGYLKKAREAKTAPAASS